MKLIEKALEFEKRSMARLSTSDRIKASREAKSLVLAINDIYKRNRDPYLMKIMKLVTVKKRKIDKRLKGFSLSSAV